MTDFLNIVWGIVVGAFVFVSIFALYAIVVEGWLMIMRKEKAERETVTDD